MFHQKRLLGNSLLVLLAFAFAGCSWFMPEPARSTLAIPDGEDLKNTFKTLSVLSGIGGISILGGIALLIVTKGAKGYMPIIVGVVLVIINEIINQYFDVVAIYFLVISGIISFAWMVAAARRAFIIRKNGDSTCLSQNSNSNPSLSEQPQDSSPD